MSSTYSEDVYDIRNLRYILFMIDSDHKQHEGEIFTSLQEAKEYAADAIKWNLCTKYIIGLFVLDIKEQRMGISHIETFGFKGDKKDLNQLELFTPYKSKS